MAKVYADLIELELRTFAQVPKFLKPAVKAELEARGLGHLAQ